MHAVHLALGLAFASCTSTPIEVRDTGVLQPGARLLLRFDEPGEDRPWTGVLVEADLAEGDDQQTLALGETVELDGIAFTGPAQVEVEYELRRECLAYTFGATNQESGLDFGLELGYARVVSELELAAGSTRAKEHAVWDGLHTAIGLLWAATDVLGFEGRVAFLTDFDDFGSDMKTIELGGRVFPRSPFGLFVGWRWIDLYQLHDTSSDLDLRANGPELALRVTL